MRKKRRAEWGIFVFSAGMSALMTGLASQGAIVEEAGETEIWENHCRTQWESESGLESENETESENGLESESELELESGLESESELESETEIESESELESEKETKPESQSESESETGLENETQTELQGNAELKNEEEPENETESDTEPVTDQITESAAEPITEAATEPITEPITEAATEPITESAAEPITEAVTDPITEAAMEPITESAAEPITEGMTEPITELAAEPITEAVTESAEPATSSKDAEPRSESAAKPDETRPKNAAETKDETNSKSMVPQIPAAGRDYQIQGDPNAWYRDQNGKMWVRQGTSLYVEATGSQYNHGAGAEKIMQDGSLTFCLQQLSREGEVLKQSAEKTEAYYVDADVPAAEIEAEGTYQGGIIYASEDAGVSFTVPPDGKSGLAKIDYRILPCTLEGNRAVYTESQDWTACGSRERIKLTGEGYYSVFVRTVDHVGNTSFSQSGVICVDQTPPQLEISGVGDRSANSGEVSVALVCRDDFYRKGSFQVTLRGKNNGKIIQAKESSEEEGGAKLVYADIPMAKEYDDVYELTASAEDLAGNRISRTISFSVNRHGSVYELSDSTREALKKYYLQEPAEVTFCETNIDYVGNAEIFCRHDGEMRTLKENRDYFIQTEGNQDSWKQYQYRISPEVFKEEGVYELLLTSADQASNTSDTGLQEKKVTFVVDRTPPSCVILGVEHKEICDASSRQIRLLASDNIRLQKMKIYHNSRLVQELGEEDLERAGGVVEMDLAQSPEWQTLQVFLEDAAGNQFWTEETAFYIQEDVKGEIPEYKKSRDSARELLSQSRENVELLSSEENSKVLSLTHTAAEKRQSGSGEKTEAGEWKDLFFAAGAGAFIWALCLQVFSCFTRKR